MKCPQRGPNVYSCTGYSQFPISKGGDVPVPKSKKAKPKSKKIKKTSESEY